MGSGAASAIAIVVGSVAVVCAISRTFCHYMSTYFHFINAYTDRPFSDLSDFGARDGPGPRQGALLILNGLALITLHAGWLWPDSIDSHDASVVASIVMCGVSLLFMVDLDGLYWAYGLAILLLGAGNALIQLSFVWQRPILSYWGLGVVLLGLLVSALSIVVDVLDNPIFYWIRSMWRYLRRSWPGQSR